MMGNNKPGNGKIRIRVTREIVEKLNSILHEFLPSIYTYNNLIKGEKYYLKPVHIVSRKLSSGSTVKYYYYGRYWYKIEKNNKSIKWIYLGKEKPSPSLPDPPENPLEGLVVKKIDDGNMVELVIASEELFRKLYDKLFQR
ncbi:hypothetical protein [Desulfurococcus sp.]|uniref:hypothetical protein n=1 Tax=Desulfurococcus sp. TaxID=51678 RepID=UPI00316628EE